MTLSVFWFLGLVPVCLENPTLSMCKLGKGFASDEVSLDRYVGSIRNKMFYQPPLLEGTGPGIN